MPQTPLSPDTNFVVKEDVFLNFLIAGLCFVFFVVSLITFSWSYIDYFSIPFFLGPTILFASKGFKNRTLITINKQGIFYHNKLFTDWHNFNNAYIKEEEKLGRVSDNFILIIKCYNETKGDYVNRKIKLSNTQSQSEEAILGGIRYFHKLWKAKEGML